MIFGNIQKDYTVNYTDFPWHESLETGLVTVVSELQIDPKFISGLQPVPQRPYRRRTGSSYGWLVERGRRLFQSSICTTSQAKDLSVSGRSPAEGASDVPVGNSYKPSRPITSTNI